MQEATCKRCGASLVLSAKFCRQCGNRLDGSDDPSELTTRTLAEPQTDPQAFDHPTRPANAAITAPTYPPPAMMHQQPPPPVPIIGSAPPASNNTVLFVVLGIVLAMLIGMGALAFVVFNRQPAVIAPPPPPDVAQTDKSTPPPRPEFPQPPPGAKTGSVQFPFDAALLYPNAKTLMVVNKKDGRFAQLQSPDPVDKVADWYKDKLKATEDVFLPGQRIMTGEGVKVILAGGKEGTVIMLADDKD